MKLILASLLCAACATSGHARLGENYKDLKKRYGLPLEAQATKEARSSRYTFRWDRFLVTVIVEDGYSVSEEFTREDGKEFILSEVQLLLVESSEPGLPWTKVDGSSWKQKDRVGTWSGRSLVVQEKARAR